MNPENSETVEKHRQTLREQLMTADSALRANLHMHGLDLTGRAHMERALAHVREAYVAVTDEGRARTVHQLVTEMLKMENLYETVRPQQRPVRRMKL
jgi:hypothetical protein